MHEVLVKHLGLVGWLFCIERPVLQPISGRLPKRGRKRIQTTKESKNVQTTPTRTYWKHNRPLPYCHPNCRTPRHWKFTQYHCPLRQYFCLYRAVCQREGDWLVGCFGFDAPLRHPFETVFKSISGCLPERGSLYRAVTYEREIGWLVVLGLTAL